jgi:hypothetical protein
LTSRRYVRHFLAWHRTCVTQVFEKSDRSRLEQSVQKRTHLNLTVASISFSIEVKTVAAPESGPGRPREDTSSWSDLRVANARYWSRKGAHRTRQISKCSATATPDTDQIGIGGYAQTLRINPAHASGVLAVSSPTKSDLGPGSLSGLFDGSVFVVLGRAG